MTIELKGAIPDDRREDIGGHVYGCDICQEVCPWNARPSVSTRPEWTPRPEFDRPRLADLWRASDDRLRRALRGSAMSRAKLRGIRRNVAVAIGNTGRREIANVFDEGDEDPSASPSKHDRTVQEHVDWAKRKLGK